MNDFDPHDAIQTINDNKDAYSVAKGQLAELDAFKSSLKAIKMSKSKENSLGAQEREAYASQEYQDHCKALGLATRNVERLKWTLTVAQMEFDAWRTEQASNRNLEKMTR